MKNTPSFAAESELDYVVISPEASSSKQADETYIPSTSSASNASNGSDDSNASNGSDDSDLDFEQAIEKARARLTRKRGRGRGRGRGKSRGSQKETGAVAVSRSELRHQTPDPFSTSTLTVAPNAKNAFDVMGKAQKRNQKKRTHPLTVNSKQPRAKRQKGDDALISAKASGSGVRSNCWNWFSEERNDGTRFGICIVQMPDGKPCSARIRTGDSTTNLWRHLKGRHGYNQSGEPPVTCSER